MQAIFIVAVAVFWFAITNTQEITVDFFLWYVSAPLAVIIGITFILGFFVGIAQLVPGFLRHRGQAKKSAKAVDALEKERDSLQKDKKTLEEKIHLQSSEENKPENG